MPDEHHGARQYAPAAARNAGAICEVLGRHLPVSGTILEIGSGTGQHVAAFATAHPALSWQPSDPDPELRASITAWTAGLANVRAPLDLDVTTDDWARALEGPLAGIVCINLLHIAPWAACAGLMAGAGALLEPRAPLYLYGAFKRGGVHTAPSNAAFDRVLRAYHPDWGVRDLEAVVDCAAAHGLDLIDTVAMPSNNLSVILRLRGRRHPADTGDRADIGCPRRRGYPGNATRMTTPPNFGLTHLQPNSSRPEVPANTLAGGPDNAANSKLTWTTPGATPRSSHAQLASIVPQVLSETPGPGSISICRQA